MQTSDYSLTGKQRFCLNVSEWRIALVHLGLALFVLIAAFWETFFSIIVIWWRSQTFAHGFLILPIVAYLIWQRRKDLVSIQPYPSGWGVGLLVFLVLGWLLAHSVDVQVVKQLAVVAMLPVLVYVILGITVLRKIIFPLGYLIFAVPIGEFIVPVLQDFTAAFAVYAIELSGLPVFIEGRYISIPNGRFEVAEACSGIRYLIASLALGTLFAYITYTNIWHRFIFVIVCGVVPILANAIRAYAIIMLAYLSDHKIATGVDHVIYGWLFFGVVMSLLFIIGIFVKRWLVKEEVQIVDSNILKYKTNFANKSLVPYTAIVLLIILSSPLSAAWLNSQVHRSEFDTVRLPPGVNGWLGPSGSDNIFGSVFKGAVEQQGIYRKDAKSVYLYIAYYSTERQGAELINSQNKLFDNYVWRRMGEKKVVVGLSNGTVWEVRSAPVYSEDRKSLLYYWYQLGDSTTLDVYKTKLYQLGSLFFKQKYGPSIVLITADYQIDSAEAQTLLVSFMEDMLPGVRNVFR